MENKIRTATLGIAEEFRKMEIGEKVMFPIPKYNYNSVRASPGTTLIADRIAGKSWKVALDIENKCVMVTRTA